MRFADANDRVKQFSGARYFQEISSFIQAVHYLPLTAAGGAATRQYDFTDAGAAPGGVTARYYRIKQTDRDGQVSYSITRSIRHNSQSTWSIFPNPVQDGFTIQVPSVNGLVRWNLVGANGQMLLQRNKGVVMAGRTYVDLRFLCLSTGLYHVQVFVDAVRVLTLPVWVR